MIQISTTSTFGNRHNGQTRTYDRAASIVFLKTREAFGGLSNMAGGFPLCVNGIRIRTSEALYQACRFPHLPAVQRVIVEQRSPMTAKMKSRKHQRKSRPDWDMVRVKIMRWCLQVKLIQNWEAFRGLLLETGDQPIVEQSRKDDFWGAEPVDKRTLVGVNALGRLLMELREVVKNEGVEVVLYARVSSYAQKDALRGQVALLQSRYPGAEIIKDIGGGLNWKRKGLVALLGRLHGGEKLRLVVAHKDRLARFGFELVEWLAKQNGGEVVVLDESKCSPEQELTEDILSILHTFSCRLSGLRKYRDKIKEDKNLSER